MESLASQVADSLDPRPARANANAAQQDDEKEIALYLNVSVAFLRQSRMKNPPPKSTVGPPFYKYRKLVRYRIEDLDAWLAEHRVDPRLPLGRLLQGA